MSDALTKFQIDCDFAFQSEERFEKNFFIILQEIVLFILFRITQDIIFYYFLSIKIPINIKF